MAAVTVQTVPQAVEAGSGSDPDLVLELALAPDSGPASPESAPTGLFYRKTHK